MSILTEAAAAVREALPLRRARHAAESSDHLDCPEGSPGGPCEACGSETSRKQPYVATGVYSPYALCEDRRACEDRGTRKERQAAIRARAGAQEPGEPEDSTPGTLSEPEPSPDASDGSEDEDAAESEDCRDDAAGRS